MVMNIADAVAAAYRQGGAGSAIGGATDTSGGGSFADALKSATDSVVDTLKTGEKAANGSVTGNADLVSVVTAVSDAQSMLQTVTAIRDKVISAYQSIIQEQI